MTITSSRGLTELISLGVPGRDGLVVLYPLPQVGMTELYLFRSDYGAGNKTQGLLSLACYNHRMISPWLCVTPMVWRVAIDFHDSRHDAIYFPCMKWLTDHHVSILGL